MKWNKIFSSIFIMFFCFNSHAWWEAGHMLVADVAYANLSPKAKEQVKILLPFMNAESNYKHSYVYNKSKPNYTMMAISVWPDHLNAYPNFLRVNKTLHYIEDAYANDGTKIPLTIPRDNVVFAIKQYKGHLAQRNASKSSRSRALAYLIHFIGDIHQPLHTAEYYSKELPNGDRGGNSFKVNYKESNGDVIKNLHSLWDSALLLFPSKNFQHNVSDPKDIHKIMSLISHDYPQSYFSDRAKVIDPVKWQQESHQLGINAHELPMGSTPINSYLLHHTQIAEQQIVLAGYRLANLLNTIFK